MNFYVYQHRRNDCGAVFYVGKGHGQRMHKREKRNLYWQRVAAKHGFTSDLIANGLEEDLAFLVEQEAIDVYRRRGIVLTNMTDGGEGASGYRHTAKHKAKLRGNTFGAASWGLTFKGKNHSAEQKEIWSAKRAGVDNGGWKGKKRTEENRAKIRAAKIGVPNLTVRKLTEEHVKEIRATLGYRQIALFARRYGVGESTIRRIRDGELYKEVR